MHNPRSPTRVKSTQVPTLPPLVAPWHQEELIPSTTHPKSQTSPRQPYSLGDPSHIPTHITPELEGGGSVKRRLEDLESRIAGVEQANTVGSMVEAPTGDVRGREEGRGEGAFQKEMARISSEMTSHLKQLEQRVFQNEHRESAQMATLVESTQETQRRIVEVQRQLETERREQGEGLRGLKERLEQLEQRQLQLAESSRKTNEGLSTGVGRVGKDMGMLRARVETQGSVGGQMIALGHRHSRLEENMKALGGSLASLQRTAAELKKQKKHTESRLSEVRVGLREVEGRLGEVGRQKEKQDTQLRESVQAELERNSAHLREMFLGELRESSAATAAQWSQLREQVVSVIEYSRQECLRERESLRKELESRLTATEEALEANRKECSTHLKDLRSSVEADSTRTRSDLTEQIRATTERGEQGRKVLQGAVSVAEEEAKVTRQELLSVIEAEIKTRCKEVSELQAEQRKLSGELGKHTHSVRSSLEAMEQAVNIDREQLQLLQDSLVQQQWQEVGVGILGDTDTPLKAADKLWGQTPLSQASYLIEEDDYRGEEDEREGGDGTLASAQYQTEGPGEESATNEVPLHKHQLLNTRKYGAPSGSRNRLYSKSRIVLSPPELHHTQDDHTTAEQRKLPDITEQEGTATTPDESGKGEIGESREEAIETPVTLDQTKHSVVDVSTASGEDEFGKDGEELNSSAISSSSPTLKSVTSIEPGQEQQVTHSPTEPTDKCNESLEASSEGSLTEERRRAMEEGDWMGDGGEGGEVVGDKTNGEAESGESGGESKVVWTIGGPSTAD